MDTADYRRLVEAFDQEKAMAIAEVIERSTITPPAFEAAMTRLESRFDKLERKMDVAIAELRAEMRSEMAELRGEMRTSVADLRTEVRTSIADVRTEVAHSRGEMLKWMAGVAVGWVVAVAGIAFAIVRLGTP